MISDRYNEVKAMLNAAEPGTKEYIALSKEYSSLSKKIDTAERINKIKHDIEEIRHMLLDEDMYDIASQELNTLENELQELERHLDNLMYRNEDDARNAILEIRAGTGGDEASLFGLDLFNMYIKYSDIKGWKHEVLDYSDNELRGIKEARVLFKGEDAYLFLKNESGVHRVQRVPKTESSGRIHTSAATIAILPEVEESDIEIKQQDLKIDVFRSSGPGGQSVNTTDSAVRITHIPTGVVVQQQDEKSQYRNKEKALKILRARIYDMEKQKIREEEARKRKEQVGTGDRSERVRTYNFPQGRVTDHRTGTSIYDIENVMNGQLLDKIIYELLSKRINS